jgi:hypothetical protein
MKWEGYKRVPRKLKVSWALLTETQMCRGLHLIGQLQALAILTSSVPEEPSGGISQCTGYGCKEDRQTRPRAKKTSSCAQGGQRSRNKECQRPDAGASFWTVCYSLEFVSMNPGLPLPRPPLRGAYNTKHSVLVLGPGTVVAKCNACTINHLFYCLCWRIKKKKIN